MIGSFKNGNFDLKSPITKINLHQIKVLYSINHMHRPRATLVINFNFGQGIIIIKAIIFMKIIFMIELEFTKSEKFTACENFALYGSC